GHVLLRLVAGVAEHHALVARPLLLEQPLARGHALGDVRRLLLDRDDYRAAVAVEARFGTRVADVADHALGDLAELHLALAGDLAGHHHEAGLDERLAGDAALGVLGEKGIDDAVGYLVADLVGLA